MFENESERSYELTAEFAHFDKDGNFTPAGYQYLVNTVVDKHLIDFDVNFEKLMPLGISWVVLSIAIDIINPIKNREQKIIGKTWYSERKRIHFRREVSLYLEDGTHILNCAMYSTLLDLSTRSIYRNRELPFKLMTPTEIKNLDANPTFKEKIDFVQGEKNLVKRSYLDMLGHVNNTRYSDFCFDALDEDEANLNSLKRMEIYFVSELKSGEEFSVNKHVSDGRIILQGYNESQQKPAFYGVYYK